MNGEAGADSVTGAGQPLQESGWEICVLSCGFAGRASGRLLDRGPLALTVADSYIWHGCGTNLSRRQSATMAGAPTGQARVCLAASTPASTTLPACVVDQRSRDGQLCRSGARALSLGSCGHLRLVRALPWAIALLALSPGVAAFTVVPCRSPSDLVRLGCRAQAGPCRLGLSERVTRPFRCS